MSDTQHRSKYFRVLTFVLFILFTQMGLVLGQSETAPTMHLSRRDLHKLLKTANTSEQYRTLKAYYLGREKKYEHEADLEK